MALLSGFVFSESIELFPPLISSIVFLSPSQQHYLFSLVFLSLNTYFLVVVLLVVTLTSITFTSVVIVCVSTIG